MNTARALFVVALITGLLFVGGIWRVGNQQAAIEQQGKQNANALSALCALKADLERRIKTTRKFLEQHPNGIPGIPAETLRQTLNGQRKTVRAIAPYLTDCKETV